MAARRLTAIAAWINERTGLLGLTATARPSRSSTDRKIRGTRLRHPGKGRAGTRIEIVSIKGDRFTLDNSQTYRTNEEVEHWLKSYIATLSAGTRLKLMKVGDGEA